MRAFITGSRAYGSPTPESDVDLVVLCDFFAHDMLRMFADEKGANDSFSPKGDSLRFGKLNLIVFTTESDMAEWLVATDKCRKIKPVTKNAAIPIFQAIEGVEQ